MSMLKDRIHPLDPSSNQEFLEPDGETGAEGGTPERFAHPHIPAGRTKFELESRGGFLRTVTGTVAYLDEDAETYMVLRGNGDGQLVRVPLRDITSAHETVPSGRLHAVTRDAEGLGTAK
jgi:hypothetical protein